MCISFPSLAKDKEGPYPPYDLSVIDKAKQRKKSCKKRYDDQRTTASMINSGVARAKCFKEIIQDLIVEFYSASDFYQNHKPVMPSAKKYLMDFEKYYDVVYDISSFMYQSRDACAFEPCGSMYSTLPAAYHMMEIERYLDKMIKVLEVHGSVYSMSCHKESNIHRYKKWKENREEVDRYLKTLRHSE